MPRCTRCDAPLGGDEPTLVGDGPRPRDDDSTATRVFGDDSATRFFGDDSATRAFGDDVTVPDSHARDPYAPPPVPPQDPPPWMTPPSAPGETAISLSPEPWDEPQMWQPPPPRKRRRAMPYLLFLAGWVVLVAVAVAIVLWPRGDGGGAAPSTSTVVSPQKNESATAEDPSPEESPSGDGDAAREATEIDGLLSEMATTRSELGGVIAGGCRPSALERIRRQRQEQLSRARALEVDDLDQGAEMKDALVRALQASVESNQRYLDAAPGCPSDSEVADVNGRASDAKAEFMRYWQPIAEQQGLSPRSADTI
ncbi:hypothetical protein [Actinomadura sp. NBRC 104425]|uniref:hypothetical protein n=1 Tax=Actinomadura sp. NBRC 104425 TaxID=3032204 RepID=UPI002553B4BA|nr:hypothetical protein [Actinomadura sp. NBRC 104425]